mmetsp:Transcript_35/g.79  ORF Transcript_35/g.79 Transcript_35/m.79 type:complete len:85 (+) Transcript_35:301-555(+)
MGASQAEHEEAEVKLHEAPLQVRILSEETRNSDRNQNNKAEDSEKNGVFGPFIERAVIVEEFTIIRWAEEKRRKVNMCYNQQSA